MTRICAICLGNIERVDYDLHMHEDHGYESLDVTPPCAICLDQGYIPPADYDEHMRQAHGYR